MPPPGHIMPTHNIDFDCYTDDMQLYVPLKLGTTDVPWITVRIWMSKNVLQFKNPNQK